MAAGPQGEDCLSLNVFTPACDGERRPVLVWIHGGGFRTGASSQAMYEGRALVERGDVVLVTINYRLGALGYLCATGTDANAGQLDQVQALEWVRDNIHAFGGDPNNVTIFGESAGGMACATLLGMPRARGLFHRAIAQSGAAQSTLSREQADRVAFELARALDLDHADLDRLRAQPVEDIVAASVRAGEKLAGDVFLPWAPVIDPGTLPRSPLAAVRDGEAKDVELIVGTTRDEWRLFTFAVRNHRSMDGEALRKRVSGRLVRRLPDDADAATERLIEVYSQRLDQPWEIFDAIETDRLFRLPALELAEAQRKHQPATFSYLFSWPSPAGRGALGACHALELPFVFGTLDAPTMDRFAGRGPDAERLSEAMMDAWLGFARTGNPSHDGIGNWAAFDTGTRETLVFAQASGAESDPLPAERRVWESFA